MSAVLQELGDDRGGVGGAVGVDGAVVDGSADVGGDGVGDTGVLDFDGNVAAIG